MAPLLQVKGLGKYFELHQDPISRLFLERRILKAVDDIDFSVEAGKTLGLVGESGCGKSTTARLITRLIEPTFGKIYFEGEDILALKKSQMRRMRFLKIGRAHV